MARKISSRILVKGTLVAVCPVHVGGMSPDPEVDLTLAMDGQGRFYIPGTSLAGTLRAWMTAAGDQNIVNFLWGALTENKKPNHASFILVEDAPITEVVSDSSNELSPDMQEELRMNKIKTVLSEIRDGVGIDRILGTSAERMKYTQAILPKGSKIPLEMTIELQNEDTDSYLALLHDLLESLKNQHLRLGASKTRGLGRVKLKTLSLHRQTLNTTDGIMQALRHQGVANELEDLSTNVSLNLRPRLTLSIDWNPIDSLMVKSESDGVIVDHLPLVSAIDETNLAFVLPGSSIKGALRTQAERIVRTVKQLDIPDSDNLQYRFMEQLEQTPLITALFGRAAKVKRNGKMQQIGQIGALAVDDCYSQSRIHPLVWNRITSAKTSAELDEELTVSLPNTQQGFHVAIDRWTGGAADGMLYSTLEPRGIEWEPITLSLDLAQLERNWLGNSEVPLTLLLLVLRDFMAGRIPLGHSTNRGMGAVNVKKIQINGDDLPDKWSSLQDITLVSDYFQVLDSKFVETLQKTWIEWINEPSETASGVEITA